MTHEQTANVPFPKSLPDFSDIEPQLNEAVMLIWAALELANGEQPDEGGCGLSLRLCAIALLNDMALGLLEMAVKGEVK